LSERRAVEVKTCHVVFALAELLKLQKNGQFPDDPVRVKVQQIHYVTSHSS
jgi:hypothetical protein